MTFKRTEFTSGLIIAILLFGLLAGCGGSTMKIYPTADEQYSYSMKEYGKRHYLKAIDGFQKLIYNFSGAAMVDSAQFYLAQSYYSQKDYYMAASEFERLVNTYPGSPFVDNSQYMTGLCYFKSSPGNYGLDQTELLRAIEALEDFITDYPESDAHEDAQAALNAALERLAQKRFESGRTYLRLSYYKSADIYFQTVIDEHTDSEWSARALFYQGELNYKRAKFEEALQKFNNFMVVYPEHELVEKARQMVDKTNKKLAETTEKE